MEHTEVFENEDFRWEKSRGAYSRVDIFPLTLLSQHFRLIRSCSAHKKPYNYYMIY